MTAPVVLSIAPATEIEVVLGPDKEFRGLGAVRVDGVALRDSRQPIALRLETPEGVIYPRLVLRETIRTAGGATVLRLAAHGLNWGRGRLQDDYMQECVWLQGDPAEDLVDEVELILEPASLELEGRSLRGFSWSVRFASEARRIHRVLVMGTWEIGGRITGNTVLSQGQCNRPVWKGSRAEAFTTACLRTLDRYGKWPGFSFQLGPRAGLVQGFDFQYSRDGALLQWWPELDSVSSLQESPPDDDRLHIVDEVRFPLAAKTATPAKQVLFWRGNLAEHEARDMWWAAREHIYGAIRRRFGITATLVRPECQASNHYHLDNGRVNCRVLGDEVDHARLPWAIADRVLPILAERGVKRFFPEVMSESDVTVLGLRCKLDNGQHGDLHCASVCATHRFLPSEFWGGMKGWRYMYDAAQKLGIQLGAWFAPHFSPRAPAIQEHPEWLTLDNEGLPAGGGYSFHTLVTGDWNTGLTDWVFADLKRWKEEGGLDFLFTDSLSNLGLNQISYGNEMRTNFAALGRLYGRIQRELGIAGLSFECTPAFGTGYFGVTDLRGDLVEQDRSVAGQNDLGWWVGEEDMAIDELIWTTPRRRTDEEVERMLFRAAAARGSIMLHKEMDMTLAPWPFRAKLNRIYEQALPHMQGRRRVLPDRAGIRWEDGNTQVVWAFTDLPAPAGKKVERLEGNEVAPCTGKTLPAWGVYRIR